MDKFKGTMYIIFLTFLTEPLPPPTYQSSWWKRIPFHFCLAEKIMSIFLRKENVFHFWSDSVILFIKCLSHSWWILFFAQDPLCWYGNFCLSFRGWRWCWSCFRCWHGAGLYCCGPFRCGCLAWTFVLRNLQGTTPFTFFSLCSDSNSFSGCVVFVFWGTSWE